MKKILYLNFVPEREKGVLKKIKFQKKAVENNGYLIETSEIKDDYFILKGDTLNCYKYGENIFEKLKNKIDDFLLFSKLKNKKFYKDIDIIYMRYIGTLPWRLSYYKYLKKLGKKIVLEIATYPYDGEVKKENIFTKMDKKYRLELYKYIDKIVTYSKDKEIFKVPCINISNGIDLDEVKLVKKEKRNSCIVFTSVSTCAFWHGIDRILNSILEYKKRGGNKELVFNIVGEGFETKKLKKIVEENPILQKIVIFHGFKSGREIDEIYNNTDIAIGSLGIHRIKGLKEVQPLKNREYCAKGLPFIISFKDPDFINKDFVYSEISNDDENFEIARVIEWYKNLKTTPEEMREYSRKFSWDIQMKKVIDNI